MGISATSAVSPSRCAPVVCALLPHRVNLAASELYQDLRACAVKLSISAGSRDVAPIRLFLVAGSSCACAHHKFLQWDAPSPGFPPTTAERRPLAVRPVGLAARITCRSLQCTAIEVMAAGGSEPRRPSFRQLPSAYCFGRCSSGQPAVDGEEDEYVAPIALLHGITRSLPRLPSHHSLSVFDDLCVRLACHWLRSVPALWAA
ncbi:hypothetical protein EJ03DRAFT_10386 [Teratosphaeria nubilosa]|uniref:Uncharacterized protein n=1 Tax=Teratosphaeria nubilosa TaxID=161662 RepID=A0A6G1LH21_9PEZI|nr:hypothetical protein EJ03DRAFT_10386 [Teratosphaeria nubilosa]